MPYAFFFVTYSVFLLFESQQQSLGSAGVPGYDFNGGFGDFEAFCKILNAHLVGRTIHRRRLKLDFQGVGMLTGDHVFRRSRLNKDFEYNSVTILLYKRHFNQQF